MKRVIDDKGGEQKNHSSENFGLGSPGSSRQEFEAGTKDEKRERQKLEG